MYKIYKIENSQTLKEIADNLGIDIQELETINGINQNTLISMGEQIIIPSINTMDNYSMYIVKPGDNMYAIAKKYDVDLETLLSLNGLEKSDYIYPNQQILIPRRNLNIYVTRPNDTIKSIADALNYNVNDLINQNEFIYVLPDQSIIYKMEN